MKQLLEPNEVHWCTGSKEEYNELCDVLVSNGSLVRLNNDLRPNSFLFRTHPEDTSKNANVTFVCTPTEQEAGPLNNWAPPQETKEKMCNLFQGSMRGRTMYVLVYSMGPLGSPYSRFGVQVTDSPYVVLSTCLQVRVGTEVMNVLKDNEDLWTCVHSVGYPLVEGRADVGWPCNLEQAMVAYFSDPKKNEFCFMSYGSAWGSNAIACRMPHSLGIASLAGRTQGWLAECCAILGITSPEGKKIYVAAALPKGCGKTALSMIIPSIPGWTVRCVGEDVAWLHIGEDGRLWAINPMRGFYDVATGTSDKTNRAGIAALSKNVLFTNTGLTEDGDVWWEGMSDVPPTGKIIDWSGNVWQQTQDGTGSPCAHPNSRYTTLASQCPVIDPEWENPYGVPISAFIFGGKRKDVYPLVTEATSWEQGVFLASTIGRDSDTGVIRTPFSVSQFLGYNINEYLKHWIDVRSLSGYNIPKIFIVNWFRQDSTGQVIWPGFRENSRVLKWIHRRSTGYLSDGIVKTPIGLIPEVGSLDLRGCHVIPEKIEQSLLIKKEEWLREGEDLKQFYQKFGDDFPKEIWRQLNSTLDELSFY
eukprot:TRINITY_DN4142_c0_g1_i3.p1 TRINITY_DN4142_c0_g1~~TRINITY_DN4142_c0_g1_i3.p1  ORF type:complete len:586 (-),score=125.83 TRINITY_DN4142_c0_g1_i3:38-1795(-)